MTAGMTLRLRLIAPVALALVACAHRPITPVTLELPTERPDASVTQRLIVLGDAGDKGPTRDSVDAALHRRLSDTRIDTTILMPGDLFYPRGLPASCQEARQWVEQLYTSRYPDVPFVVVDGNHDHGDVAAEARPQISRRVGFFDCEHRALVADDVDWESEPGCRCIPGWHYPGARDEVGVREVGAFTLVTFDSQSALADPGHVATRLAEKIDAVPSSRRLIVMAHHPFESFGAHARVPPISPQDIHSPTYAAYVGAIRPVLVQRASRIALVLFGHEHSMQYFPDAKPPMLISGAGAKETPVRGAPPEVFAQGGTPGFAELDVHADGSVDLWLVTKFAPRRYRLSNE